MTILLFGISERVRLCDKTHWHGCAQKSIGQEVLQLYSCCYAGCDLEGAQHNVTDQLPLCISSSGALPTLGDAVYMDLGKHQRTRGKSAQLPGTQPKQVFLCMPHTMIPSKHIKVSEGCTTTQERNRLKQCFVCWEADKGKEINPTGFRVSEHPQPTVCQHVTYAAHCTYFTNWLANSGLTPDDLNRPGTPHDRPPPRLAQAFFVRTLLCSFLLVRMRVLRVLLIPLLLLLLCLLYLLLVRLLLLLLLLLFVFRFLPCCFGLCTMHSLFLCWLRFLWLQTC